jgi:antitoxin MazE
MSTTVSKWGNSLALRIPREVAEAAHWTEGTAVRFRVEEGGSVTVAPRRPRYELSELLARVTPENRHEPVEWGPPVGDEAW